MNICKPQIVLAGQPKQRLCPVADTAAQFVLQEAELAQTLGNYERFGIVLVLSQGWPLSSTAGMLSGKLYFEVRDNNFVLTRQWYSQSSAMQVRIEPAGRIGEEHCTDAEHASRLNSS